MFRRSNLFTAVALIGALSASLDVAAQTKTTNLGIISNPFATSFGDSFSGNGSFVDNYNFTVPQNSDFSGGVETFSFNASKGISNLMATLLGPNTSPITTDSYLYNATSKVILFSGNVASGTYDLKITGNVNGMQGAYGGSFNVSPVPEPKTYAMLLLGIGFIVFTARRKARDSGRV